MVTDNKRRSIMPDRPAQSQEMITDKAPPLRLRRPWANPVKSQVLLCGLAFLFFFATFYLVKRKSHPACGSL